MDYNNFINENFSEETTTPQLRIALNTFLNQVNKIFIEAKNINNTKSDLEIYSLIFQDTEIVKNIFMSNKKNGKYVGSSRFYNIKRICLSFIRWLHDNNNINNYDLINQYITNLSYSDVVEEQNLKAIAFKSLSDVIDLIDSVGKYYFNFVDNVTKKKRREKVIEPYNSFDLLDVKSFAILAWYGLNFVEMANLKNDCLQKTSNMQYVITEHKKIPIDRLSYDVLYNYSKSSEQRTIPRGRLKIYKQTDMLYKTISTSKPQRLSNNILNLFRYFNNSAIKSGHTKLLNQKWLYMSNIFQKIYNTQDTGTNKLIDQLLMSYGLASNKSMSYHFRQQYEQWVKLFYPTK